MREVMIDDSPHTTSAPIVRTTRLLGGALLGRIGSLEVRLARDADEIEAAQRVRYRVFHEELGAQAHSAGVQEKIDADRYDDVCDHLLVFDTSVEAPATDQIVGTYRMLRQDAAEVAGGFYSSNEFEFDKLVKRHPQLRFLELGRSCVLPQYRSRRSIELLWQGIWAYVNHYRIDVMAGCASFHGTTPAAHAEALSYLAHNARAQGAWDVAAISGRYRSMDLMPAEAVNVRSALAALPPLIKGYLRVGAKIGDGCVVDHDFATTDVFVVLQVREIASRYINYYGADAQRFAA